MADAYTDLLLRIFSFDEKSQSYPVEAELDDGSRFTDGQFKLDRQALLTQELNPEAYGQTLFNALFPAGGDIRRAYDKATGVAEAKTGGRLRVRLWVDDDAVELHAVPWERIYHLHKGRPVPLGASTLTPFSRYTSLEIREPLPITETPIRMLVAVSNPANLPGGLAPANVDLEIESLRRALSELRRQDKLDVTVMPGHTDRVRGVAFSPDGTRLATSGDDGTVRLYVLPLEELISLARSRVTRTLTEEECAKYSLDPCPKEP